MCQAVESNNYWRTLALLNKDANPNTICGDKKLDRTAIYSAPNNLILRLLISKGANVNVNSERLPFDESCLKYYIQRLKTPSMIKTLIDKGANTTDALPTLANHCNCSNYNNEQIIEIFNLLKNSASTHELLMAYRSIGHKYYQEVDGKLVELDKPYSESCTTLKNLVAQKLDENFPPY